MTNFIAGVLFGGLLTGFAVYVLNELRALKTTRSIEPLSIRLAKEQLAQIDASMATASNPEPVFKLGALGPTMTRAMDEMRRAKKEEDQRPSFVPAALNPDVKPATESEIIEAARKATSSNGNNH